MPKQLRRKPSILSRAEYRHSVREHDLQTSVLGYLDLQHRKDVFWFAIPNAGKRSWKVARQLLSEGMTSGVADLCIMLPDGKVAWLEMKTVMGRQSEAQEAFQGICTALGHPYCLARTFDEAIFFLSRCGALKEIK